MSKDIEFTHSALAALERRDGALIWGGRTVSEIVAEIGRTPLYIYDRARMNERVHALRAAMPNNLSLHYAMKANPMPDVVAHMAGLVDGLDVASERELGVALRTGIEPKDISFAGPGKRDPELTAAIHAGITVNVESENELRRIAKIGDDLGIRPQVAVRVNPAFELKTAGMKMGGRPSQFGIDAERVPDVLAEIRQMDLTFRGFHVFSGSQNLRPEAIVEALDGMASLVIELANAAEMPVQFVNIGGGLGIPYFPKEQPLELEAIAAAVDRAIGRLRQSLGTFEPIMELGRYLVGEAGIYVVRVVDIKESRGHTFAVCDGGLHHHLAASGNFGQVIRKNYPLTAVQQTDDRATVSVVGPLCTPLDLLGNRITIDMLEVGSLVAVLQSGAYGRSASPLGFLSHPECDEVLV